MGLRRGEQIALAVIAVITAVAAIAHYGEAGAVLTFAIAAVALAGQAWMVSFATEQVGERLSPAATGLMQSTLGNLPELFVVIFALQKGEVVVAQTSIIGSLLANALLVLGLVIVVGARASEGRCMTFSKRLPNDTATLLLVTTFIIVVVAVALGSHDPLAKHVQGVSTVAAIALLVVYGAWVIPYVRSCGEGHTPQTPRVPMAVSVAMLAIAGVAAALSLMWWRPPMRPLFPYPGLSFDPN